MADLAKLVASLEVETAKYQRSLDRAQKKLGKFGSSQTRLLKKISKGFKVLAVGATAAFAGMSIAIVKVTKDLDMIVKAAKDANIGTDVFQRWAFAASQAGIKTTEFNAALGRANRRIGLFLKDGTGPAAKSLQTLGIAVRGASGEFRGNDAIIRDYVKALETIDNQSQKTAEITALFGDDARRLALVFAQGTDELEKFEKQAQSLGIVIGGDALKAAEDFNDQMDVLQRILKAEIAENLTKIAPALLAITQAAITLIPKIAELVQELLALFNLGKRAEIGGLQKELNRNLLAVTDIAEKLQGLRDAGVGGQPLAALQKALLTAQGNAIKLRQEIFALQRSDTIAAPIPAGGGAGGGTGGPATSPFTSASNELQEAYLRVLAKANKLAAEDAATQYTRQFEIVSHSIEDLLIVGAESGARGMVDVLLSQLRNNFARQAADIIAGALSGGGGGLFSGIASFFGGGRAHGGPVNSNRSFLVGERGPELFTPPGRGRIVPNGQMGGASVNIENMDLRGADAGVEERVQLGVEQAIAVSTQQRSDERIRGV